MHIQFPAEDLRPLVRDVVRELIPELQALIPATRDRDGYSEQEAADRLGLKVWVLRDARKRGEITASKITGRRIRYTQRDIDEYLASHRYEPKRPAGR
jgi:excisionase family DNA binding protein